MPKRKFSLFFAYFPYGGVGASPSEHPAIRNWFAKLLRDLYTKYSDQISSVAWKDFADTPITMTRNAAVLEARKANADIIVMVDSDMIPDLYLEPTYAAEYPVEAQGARPFIEVVLQEFEARWHVGPYSICAPYCGPPPYSPVYVFTWEGGSHEIPDDLFKLKMFGRQEAAMLTGVGPCAAQPTGCIAMDMRLFEMAEPDPINGKGWFYYEFKNGHHAKKDSTEDVTCTRDMAMIVQKKLGYNPLLCAWDCWAGHVKPVIVGKPRAIHVEHIEKRFAQAVRDDVHLEERVDASLGPYEGLGDMIYNGTNEWPEKKPDGDMLTPMAVNPLSPAICRGPAIIGNKEAYEEAEKLVQIYGPAMYERGCIDPQKSFAANSKAVDAERQAQADRDLGAND